MLKNQSAASETVGSCSTTVEPWNPHQFQNIQQILEEGDGGPRIYPLHLLWSDTLFYTGAVQAVFQAGQVKKKHKSCWYIPSSTTRLVLARIIQNIWLWMQISWYTTEESWKSLHANISFRSETAFNNNSEKEAII